MINIHIFSSHPVYLVRNQSFLTWNSDSCIVRGLFSYLFRSGFGVLNLMNNVVILCICYSGKYIYQARTPPGMMALVLLAPVFQSWGTNRPYHGQVSANGKVNKPELAWAWARSRPSELKEVWCRHGPVLVHSVTGVDRLSAILLSGMWTGWI